MVDDGGGQWTWTYDTTDGPDENQFVYVTATDGSSLASQVAFQLTVNNLPPSVTITSPLAGQVPLALPVSARIDVGVRQLAGGRVAVRATASPAPPGVRVALER